MKKRITKIWGVGLVLVLAASLLLSAAPISAGTLSWGTQSPFPSSTGYRLFNGSEVADIAVAEDGIMYAVTGTDNYTYKSTNGGITWSRLSKDFLGLPEFVAVAPDDSEFVVVSVGTLIHLSTNGGSTWGDLGTIVGDVTTCTNIDDLDVSNADGSVNYVGVAGDNGSVADIWWFNAGASAPKWHDTADETGWMGGLGGQTIGAAVKFSPNIASDKVMSGLTANGTDVTFQVHSLNTDTWNTPFGSGYPVNIDPDGTISGLVTGRIVMTPEYLGSDDSMRIVFLGLNTGGSGQGGIYRLEDDSVDNLDDDKDIHSLDFDGTNLVAGSSDDDKVYRSDNALGDGDFSTASSLKRPGTPGNDKVVVAWRGSEVVAGTSGPGSAFAISMDDGKSFNDVSMVDVSHSQSLLGTMEDVSVAADGSAIQLLVSDNNSLSLWRYASDWSRTLSVAGVSGYIVRVAPDDPDVVYVAQKDGKTIYYSQKGGDDKWFTRTAKYDIQDMAVESSDVLYVGVNNAATVSKSTNSGFTWATAKDTGLTGGTIHMIRSLGEDKVIVGSTSGYVAWSEDGNSSWDKINTKLNQTANVQVTASGLSDGDFIYASSESGSRRVERWEIGQSGTSWKNLEAPGALSAFGIVLVDGALYVQTANTTGAGPSETLRTLSPTSAEPSAGMWSTMSLSGHDLKAAPQSLKVSSGSAKLWAVTTSGSALYTYTDELILAGPTLVSPADNAEIRINPISGLSYDAALTWERPSKAKIYDVQVALDSGFVEKIYTNTTSSTTDSTISDVVGGVKFMPETTYYWRVRVNGAGPVKSPWSETRTFTVLDLPEVGGPPVVIEQPPAPVIAVPPTPEIVIEVPEIVLPPQPAQPAPEIVIPAAPAPAPAVPTWALLVIIIIGAVLVIALIILIIRTRRPV
jgi:hypothetical protein